MADTLSTEGNIVIEGNVSKEGGSVVFFFSYLNEESVSLQADITDNFVETNYAVQDHIALKPRTIRLKGLVGEIVFKKSENAITNDFLEKQLMIARTQNQSFLNTISNNTLLNSLIPTLGNYTDAAIRISKQVMSSIQRYQGLWRSFKRLISKNNLLITTPYTPNVNYDEQKKVLEDITSLFNNRVPVTLADFAYWQEGNSIDTSHWYIQAINIRQGDSLYMSDLEIVLKEIRIAETKTTKVDNKKYANPTIKTSDSDKGAASKAPSNPEEVKQVLEKAESNAKENVKRGLEKHPIIKGLVKGLYFTMKNASPTTFAGH